MHIAPADVHRLCAETLLDPRTVRKAYQGAPVTASARQAIRNAAERLGVDQPPEATARKRAGDS